MDYRTHCLPDTSGWLNQFTVIPSRADWGWDVCPCCVGTRYLHITHVNQNNVCVVLTHKHFLEHMIIGRVFIYILCLELKSGYYARVWMNLDWPCKKKKKTVTNSRLWYLTNGWNRNRDKTDQAAYGGQYHMFSSQCHLFHHIQVNITCHDVFYYNTYR